MSNCNFIIPTIPGFSFPFPIMIPSIPNLLDYLPSFTIPFDMFTCPLD